MTTSAKTSKTLGSSSEADHSVGKFAFEREYFRNLVFQEILLAFEEASSGGLTKAELARRLKRAPEQITRWLSSPGNLEVDTISDLFVAMGAKPSSILVPRTPPERSSAAESLLRELAILPAANRALVNKPFEALSRWSDTFSEHLSAQTTGNTVAASPKSKLLAAANIGHHETPRAAMRALENA